MIMSPSLKGGESLSGVRQGHQGHGPTLTLKGTRNPLNQYEDDQYRRFYLDFMNQLVFSVFVLSVRDQDDGHKRNEE